MIRVTERVFLGSLEDVYRLFSQKQCKVATIIVLCAEMPSRRCDAIRYVHIPLLDCEPISRVAFEQAVLAIQTATSYGGVLVCCRAGISRSPSIVAAYLHWAGILLLDDAMAHLRKLRPIIAPSTVLVASIRGHLANGNPAAKF